MIRTQIQLPDDLYREVKRVAQDREVSLAELVRRGLEYIVRVYPPLRRAREQWELPELNVGLKADPFESPGWREEANLGSGALAMVHEPKSKRYGRKGRA